MLIVASPVPAVGAEGAASGAGAAAAPIVAFQATQVQEEAALQEGRRRRVP